MKGLSSKRILVTGGAGFIGRWVVKKLLEDGHEVWILDNLSNGSYNNIKEFVNKYKTIHFIEGDINNPQLLDSLFSNNLDIRSIRNISSWYLWNLYIVSNW